ncbi:MAG: T9SS type A sorting domain-containing protein [Bacteriovoracaceae bacterium]
MNFKFIILLLLANSILLIGQVPDYIQRDRDDQKGNFANRKTLLLDNNLVRTIILNNGEISNWDGSTSAPHFEWPKGTGHRNLDGFTFMIGAKYKIIDMLGRNIIITSVETSYREEMDKNPEMNELWGVEPLPGYANANNSSIANSNDPSSWPASWPPALGVNTDWNGYWYGYFGRGVKIPGNEVFYVMDDSKDGEYSNIPWGYYPLVSDSARKGLGLRIEVRGLQFNHPALEDVIIWLYDVVNISDHDYDSTTFGTFADPGVGSSINNVGFHSILDMTFAWSPSGVGLPANYPTGYYGHAFLETPGNSANGIDDDGDGIIDERRDDFIDNDQDWMHFTDMNKNGKWDIGEPLNDDVGKDGVGPNDPQYQGADEGEGNGMPTQGEPNFDQTDKDESDQIGLTSASINLKDDRSQGAWPKNDQVMWSKMTGGFNDTSISNTDISVVNGSGPFPFKKWNRERFVIATMCGNDLADLINNKKNAQLMNNKNFNVNTLPTSVGKIDGEPVDGYSLEQNFPNPFNPATTIRYQLSGENHVTIKVYDVLGCEIVTLVNERKSAGVYEVSFDGSTLPSGTYFYRYVVGNHEKSGTMSLIK